MNKLIRHCALLALMMPASLALEATIVDIQKSEETGVSLLLNQTVTVEGVVTASGEPGNLAALFIQQPGETEWAGIQLKSGLDLHIPKVGDKVRVTGRVGENFGMTVIEFIEIIEVIGKGTIKPLALDPSLFTNYGLATTEKYESMLVELRNPEGGDVIVVAANADGNNNFGEWRIGSNLDDPATGCRILTGRQTSRNFSSLNVSYINDDRWATNSGKLNVPLIVVQADDRFPLVRGIMIYDSSNMKLLPRNNLDFVPTTPFNIKTLTLDRETGTVRLAWESEPGETYLVESSADLKLWELVMAGVPSGGTETRLDNVGSTVAGVVYFRVTRE